MNVFLLDYPFIRYLNPCLRRHEMSLEAVEVRIVVNDLKMTCLVFQVFKDKILKVIYQRELEVIDTGFL